MLFSLSNDCKEKSTLEFEMIESLEFSLRNESEAVVEDEEGEEAAVTEEEKGPEES